MTNSVINSQDQDLYRSGYMIGKKELMMDM